MNAARMLYGLYLSAQGAQNQALRLETIANNVANANTTAFKRDLAVFQDHLPFDLEHGHITHPPGDLNQSTGGTTIRSAARCARASSRVIRSVRRATCSETRHADARRPAADRRALGLW